MILSRVENVIRRVFEVPRIDLMQLFVYFIVYVPLISSVLELFKVKVYYEVLNPFLDAVLLIEALELEDLLQ